MTQKTVQRIIKRFSMLSNHKPIESICLPQPEMSQLDILSQFPREIILRIFYFLSFQDLIKVQSTCQLWRRLARDVSVWKSRFQALNSRITDIYAHNPTKKISTLSWQKRYCQAITFANWRTGSVQRLIKINKEDSRILSVKLKDNLLITLTEVTFKIKYLCNTYVGQFCKTLSIRFRHWVHI
ncbi:unnamed protein product [Rhizopus stolonifer]